MIRIALCILAALTLAGPAGTDITAPPRLIPAASGPALSRPVTLLIPDARPVGLGEALRQMSLQTGVPMQLDPDVPRDIQFSGRFTRTPLALALDALARTGALKWFRHDGVVRIAPHDDLRLIIRAQEISGEACARCKRPMAAAWRFCPWCGRGTAANPAATAPTH